MLVIWDPWNFETKKQSTLETKKLWNFDTKKLRNQETSKPRKPRNQETLLCSIKGFPLPLNIPISTPAPDHTIYWSDFFNSFGMPFCWDNVWVCSIEEWLLKGCCIGLWRGSFCKAKMKVNMPLTLQITKKKTVRFVGKWTCSPIAEISMRIYVQSLLSFPFFKLSWKAGPQTPRPQTRFFRVHKHELSINQSGDPIDHQKGHPFVPHWRQKVFWLESNWSWHVINK